MEQEQPDVAQQVVSEVAELTKCFQTYTVVDTLQYEAAAKHLANMRAKYKELTEMRLTMTRPLDESKKRIMEFFKEPLEWLERAGETIKKACVTYVKEEERKAEVQRRAEQEAERKRAEAERARLEEKAKEAIAEGDIERAVQHLETQEQVKEMTVVVPQIEKVKGAAPMRIWKAKVVDFAKLPDEYKVADLVKLGKVAKAFKNTIPVPGVVFEEEITMTTRQG